MAIPSPWPWLLQLEAAWRFDGQRVTNEQDCDIAPETRCKHSSDRSHPWEPEADLADAKHGHIVESNQHEITPHVDPAQERPTGIVEPGCLGGESLRKPIFKSVEVADPVVAQVADGTPEGK